MYLLNNKKRAAVTIKQSRAFAGFFISFFIRLDHDDESKAEKLLSRKNYKIKLYLAL